MVHNELIFSLFTPHWSIRKISNSIALHRAAARRYRNEWLRLQRRKQKEHSASPALSGTENPPPEPV